MRRPLCLLFLIMLSACSLYFHTVSPRLLDPYADEDGTHITLEGRVTRKERRMDFSGEEMTDLYIRPAGSTKEVRVQTVSPDSFQETGIGQRVTVTGEVKCFARATNPGEFDSYEYYLTQGVLFTLKKAEIQQVSGKSDVFRETLSRVRLLCSDVLDRTLAQDDAGVMRAMLLGDRSALDDELKDLYQRNGIIHILAVSGLHISILGLGLKSLLEKLCCPRGATVAVCICLMYSYGVMCGMSTSAFRAIVMFSLRLIAPGVKRTYDMMSAVSLCGIMLLMEQPRYADYSGFLMSFGAICAIGYLLPVMKELFFFLPKKWQTALLPGLCVSLAMLPVYMCYYYTFPVISLILNPLILPLMGVLLPAGILTILTGLISVSAGTVCAIPCHLILVFYEKLCLGGSALPGAVWYAGAPQVWQVTVFYLIPVTMVMLRERKITSIFGSEAVAKKGRGNHKFISALRNALLLSVGILILSYRPPVDFQISFLDVGQGDCNIILAGGDCYVVDGGSSSRQNIGKKVILPYLKYEAVSTVSAIIVSHDDEDHISGIRELLDETERGGIRCRQLIMPAVARSARGEAYKELIDKAEALRIPVTYLCAGESWESAGAVYTCLSPETDMAGESNETSLVLLAQYLNMQVLLTGDTEGTGMETVKGYLKKQFACYAETNEFMGGQVQGANSQVIRILKVAHHGSRNNTDAEMLNIYPPDVAVISCGEKNRYGHPHEETLTLLNEKNARTCVTYKTGAIILRKEDKNAVISTFSGP